jgi:hypothetical protein
MNNCQNEESRKETHKRNKSQDRKRENGGNIENVKKKKRK